MRRKNPTQCAATIRRLLLAAYDARKRSLPWRGESDPYRIWVSEVMLQQTRVDTVIPYYEKWLERFPDLVTLAEADEDEVLRTWQGLGYYSRARRLHQGARIVRERFGGALPRNSEALRGLPGIGEYTAGAVASIAFGEAVPAVDGNVKRVLSRLFDLPNPSPSEFRVVATELVDPERPGDFNEALMELGALVCVPRSPCCNVCPLDSECLALIRDTVEKRPAPNPKKKIPEVEIAVLVAVARDEDGGLHFLLRKRPDTGLLAGMWEFPGVEVVAPDPYRNGGLRPSTTESTFDPFQESAAALATEPSLDLSKLEVVTQMFSHMKARYRPFFTEMHLASAPEAGADSPKWISEKDLHRTPLPVAQLKIMKVALTLAGSRLSL